MRVFFLAKRYYTNKDLLEDRFGRLFHLPVQLAAQGANVAVTAMDYRNPEPYQMHAEGVSFRTAPATPRKLLTLAARLYGEARRARPDVLIASGDSHIGFIGLLIARKLRARFVFDVYDYYPAFPGSRSPGMNAMFFQAVKQADLVLCASEPLKQKVWPLNPNALRVENGVDTRLFQPGNTEDARRMMGLNGLAPIIGFFGSVTPSKGPLLIDACAILSDTYPSLRLLLAGRISGVNINKPWVQYQGELAQGEIPRLINACHVVAVPLANHPQNDLSGACKIAEYLACRKPVVATRVAGHAEIFRDTPGALCEPEPTSMARAIARQLETPEIAPFPESMAWEWIGGRLHQTLQRLGA